MLEDCSGGDCVVDFIGRESDGSVRMLVCPNSAAAQLDRLNGICAESFSDDTSYRSGSICIYVLLLPRYAFVCVNTLVACYALQL